MKARINYFCEPSKKNAGYEVEAIYLDVELPFLPPVGTFIKVTPNGDYLKVADVYLDLEPEGEGLAIGMEEPEEYAIRPFKDMKSEGWKIGG